MSRPDFEKMAYETLNTVIRHGGSVECNCELIADALRAAYAAGMERAAEIATTYDELDSAIWRNVTSVVAAAIRAEKEKTDA